MIILKQEDKNSPLYLQIYSQIKEDIKNGNLASHTKIYSKRKMATHLGVSINTIDTAYSQLLSEGFIESIPRKGYFVCEMDELVLPINATEEKNIKLPEHNNIIQNEIKADFATNGVDVENFPFNAWRRLIKNCFNEYDRNILNCSPLQGEKTLRELMAKYLYQSRGVNCRSEQIIIGAGTDNLLQILSYILDNQCTIATENPVYHEAYLFFKRMGHKVISVPVDHHGIQVSKLEEYKNIAVYITPSHQFPLGITMPISRRIQILNWASKENDRYIIEDDYDSEFRYNSKPIPSLQGIDCSGSVIYMGTFSKSIAPSLRISYMVLPEKLLSVFNAKYTGFSSAVSKIDHLVLTEFICK
ncbi:MAG: PLP-dependent aminotransferase family protein, partial [Lachnospiraceae bacterium]|nr:PLP-dependent aminotransferase family protein [Lachnospiraceae bacterium]